MKVFVFILRGRRAEAATIVSHFAGHEWAYKYCNVILYIIAPAGKQTQTHMGYFS